MAMKTPGVYIVEKNAFPNSVVEVATAVPAFVGYTEKAVNGGSSLARKPWRISSMAEYQKYFGGPPLPRFTIKKITDDALEKIPDLEKAVDDALAAAKGAADTLKTAEGALLPDDGTLKPLRDAVDEKQKLDAAGSTDETKKAVLDAQQALAEASKPKTDAALIKTRDDAKVELGKKAAAVDQAKEALLQMQLATKPDAPDMESARGQDSVFTLSGQDYRLSRRPGRLGGRYLMYQAMRHFFQNGGGPCYIVSVGQYGGANPPDISAGDEDSDLVGGLTPLIKEQEPTMVLTPDAVLLSRADCAIVQAAVLKHCGLVMKNRFAILDVWSGELDRQFENGSCIDNFRQDVGINFLKYSAAYYPWLHTSIVQASDVDYTAIANIDDLRALLKDELGLVGEDKDEDPKKTKAVNQRSMLADMATSIDGWKDRFTAAITDPTKKAAARKQYDDPDKLEDAFGPYRQLTHQSLAAVTTLYPKVMEELRALMNLMPPSAAMAGLYTMVDATRGVWKAPANISVAGVVKPCVEISHADQEDLNVTTAGKSINAIRSFIGEGALVWGARTLDGNSLDWRYINVRRTMIMLEESCRLAAKAMVFEPNVGNTWVTIKSMIGNFLTGIWKRGGLAGAVPDDAFSVHCGLGETMTPEDILEGILRVTVLVAISRPAEFIEITFQQQMQKS